MTARPSGGRLSLTAFEADWLWMILDTCGEIAMDTPEHVATPMPARFGGDANDAWDHILDKLRKVQP